MNEQKVLQQLQNIVEVPSAPEPDPLTIKGEQKYHEEKEKMEVERLKTEIEHLKSAFQLSNKLSTIIIYFVVGWMVAVMGFLIYQSVLSPAYRLDNWVLGILLSTTTINVLGLLYLIIRYTFNHRLKI